MSTVRATLGRPDRSTCAVAKPALMSSARVLDGDTVQDEQPLGDAVVAIPGEMVKGTALIGRDRLFLGFHQSTASHALPKVDVWEAYRKKPA